MKTKKPDIRVLCYRCWSERDSAGIKLKKKYCKYKSRCEICGSPHGYEYSEYETEMIRYV